MHSIQKQGRHPIRSMVVTNLDVWIRTPRTVLMICFLAILSYIEVYQTTKQIASYGFLMNWLEMPYVLLAYGVNFFMSGVLFLVMISELPRQHPYQNNLLIRSTKRKWLASQIGYSFLLVVVVLVSLIIFILLFSIGKTSFEAGWSDTARIEEGIVHASEAIVPQYVRENFAVITGTLYAALPLCMFWFSMTMIMLLCTLLGSQFIGLIICAFAVLASVIGSFDFAFYPKNFSIVQNMKPDIFGPGKYFIAIGAYILFNVILIAIMYWRIAYADMIFCHETR